MSINIISKYDLKVNQTKDMSIKSNKHTQLSKFDDILNEKVKTHVHNDKKNNEKINHPETKIKSSSVDNCISNISKFFVIETQDKNVKEVDSKSNDSSSVIFSLVNMIDNQIHDKTNVPDILSKNISLIKNENSELKTNFASFISTGVEGNNNHTELLKLKNATKDPFLSFEKLDQSIINNSNLDKKDFGRTSITDVTATLVSTNTTHSQEISRPISIDPSSPVLEQAKALLKPIREHIKFQLDNDIKSATVHLSPPKMGSVDLNIRLDGDRLYVQMHAVNNQIRDALQSGLDRLKNDLNMNYQGDIQLDVTSGNGSQQSNNNQQNQYVFIRDDISFNHSDVNKFNSSKKSISSNVTRFGQINYFA